MIISEALEIAMAALTIAKQQSIKDTEVYKENILIPALRELERETGINLSMLNNPEECIIDDEEWPDNKFNNALDVLQKMLEKFQEFESENGEEEKWELGFIKQEEE